jgi:hypothetical protein
MIHYDTYIMIKGKLGFDIMKHDSALKFTTSQLFITGSVLKNISKHLHEYRLDKSFYKIIL